jgi:hypothetical protein
MPPITLIVRPVQKRRRTASNPNTIRTFDALFKSHDRSVEGRSLLPRSNLVELDPLQRVPHSGRYALTSLPRESAAPSSDGTH